MGEFDVAVLIEQYAGKKLSERLYPEWRGGYYYAAHPKGDAAAPLGLMYVSRWSDAEKAAEFAEIYARSLAKRYSRPKKWGRLRPAKRLQHPKYKIEPSAGSPRLDHGRRPRYHRRTRGYRAREREPGRGYDRHAGKRSVQEVGLIFTYEPS
jgi:hypothetical protein